MGSAETAALKCGHPIVPRETLTAYKLLQNSFDFESNQCRM